MTAPARRHVALRAIVLVQLALVVLVAWSVNELVHFDNEVPPVLVLLTTAMLACTAVAFRATFRRADGRRGHRFVFMAVEGLCALLPVLADFSSGVLRGAPAGVSSSGMIEMMIGLELLAAGCVAAVAAMLTPWLLEPPGDVDGDAPYDKGLIVWAAAALVATLGIGGVYANRYDETHEPRFLVHQLFMSENPVRQRQIAARLVERKAPSDPELRGALFEWVQTGGVIEQTWSAYLLIAGKEDDGRAMKSLRALVGSYATQKAVETLALLGKDAEPALPELTRALGQPTEDWLIADIQTRSADALAQIGPPAIEAVPLLIDKLDEKEHWELRLSAAAAIDQIDPEYAARCVVGAPSVLDALPTQEAEVQLRDGCR
jgi:hypothetical protein